MQNKRIIERRDQLKAERSVWESHWQECADYVMPKRDQITTKSFTRGERKNQHLFDGTAIRANNSLAAGLHSTLTNPAVKFFDLTTGRPSLDADESAREWLQVTADEMWNVIQNSNFQTEAHEMYLDLGVFGTGPLYIEEHPERIVNFMAYPVADVYLSENARGEFDEIYRVFEWTPKKIIEEFGDEGTVPDSIKRAMKNDSGRRFKLLHAVYPNTEGEVGKVFEYVSKYILEDERDQPTLSLKGYREFPWAAPRWSKESWEKYGRSPAMDVIADVRTLNQMVRTILKGAQKIVDPPLQATDDGLLRKIDLRPGAINRIRAGSEGIRPIQTGGRVDIGMEMIQVYREEIRKAFFLDLFTMPPLDRATQIEVQQHVQEQQRMLGPLLGRMHSELLRPTINRVYGIMSRRDMIPPVPDVLQGVRFEAVFSSPLARAQKAMDAETVLRTFQMIAGIAQIDQSVFDNFDVDDAARFVAKQSGYPQNLLRSDQEIEQMREARDNANQQQIQREQQQQQADMIAKTAPAMAQMQQ